MGPSLRRAITLLVGCCVLVTSCAAGADQPAPGLRIMVPTVAGGGYDVTARTAAVVAQRSGVAPDRIPVFNVDGEVFAIDDACTDDGGPLSEGPVQGDEVVCPWCGSRFSIVSGQARGLPAMEDVASYEVRVTGDNVEVEV